MLVDAASNTWTTTCWNCEWTETKEHAHCLYEMREGELFLDGVRCSIRMSVNGEIWIAKDGTKESRRGLPFRARMPSEQLELLRPV